MQRDPETGSYVGRDECHHQTEWEALSIGTLGMCGCGQPEEAYNLLRQMLACFDRDQRGWEDVPEEKIAELVKANPELTAHIISHYLTSRKVIEHGGSVGGSWLTPAGLEIVRSEPAPLD